MTVKELSDMDGYAKKLVADYKCQLKIVSTLGGRQGPSCWNSCASLEPCRQMRKNNWAQIAWRCSAP